MRSLLLLLFLLLPAMSQAQESDAGFLARQVEQALSGEGRTVRLNGVSGLLSSSATVREITIADRDGVWLRISGAAIDWTRLDLFRGRLTVNTLAAERIDVLRTPVTDLSVTPEAPAIAVPVLPVAVNVGQFRIGKLVFAEGVFGLAAELSADGTLAMVNGGLDLSLRADRLDQPGGALLDATYDVAADRFDFNLDVQEPPGGVIANALNLREAPSVEFRFAGSGPVAGLDLAVTLRTDGIERVTGAVRLNRDGGFLGLKGEVAADIGDLVSGPAQPVFAGPVRLEFEARDRGTQWEIGGFDLETATLGLHGQGVAGPPGFEGGMVLSASDLRVLSLLAGAEIAGQAQLGLDGRLGFPNGDFDLAVSGSAEGLVTGVAALDGVLGGETVISGQLRRDGDGLHAQGLRLEGSGGQVKLDGNLTSGAVNARISAELDDIGDLGLPVTGAAGLDLTVSGDPASPAVAGTAAIAEMTLQGRQLSNAEVHFDGLLANGGFSGIAAAGLVAEGMPVRVSGRVVAGPDGAQLTNLVGQAASLNLNGSFSLAEDGERSGELTGSLGDLADFSGLAGIELSGRADLIGVSLRPEGSVSLTAFLSEVSAAGLSAGDAGLRAEWTGGDIAASLSARSLSGGGLALRDMRLAVLGEMAALDLDLSVSGPGQTAVTASAKLAGTGSGRALTLETAVLRAPGGEVVLDGQAVLHQTSDGFTLGPTTFVAGGGTATLEGRVGPQVEAVLSLKSLPLSLLQPYLQTTLPQGAVSGDVLVSGPMSALVARFDLASANLAMPGLQAAIGTFSVNAKGSATTSELRLDALNANGASGLGLKGSGRISFEGGPMDLVAEGRVPLGLAGAFSAGRFEAGGAANVNVRARGTLAKPDLQGEISVAGGTFTDFSSNLRLNQISLLARFSGSDLVLSSASARSSAGGGLTATGRIGFAGGQLAPDVTIDLKNLAWADGRTIYARLSGQMALRANGGGSLLSGNLTLGETIIVIPENTAGLSARGIPDVVHSGHSAGVQTTLDRVQATAPNQGTNSFVSRLMVDITISAPGRVFVRGRGLDAEMQGSMRITGPVTDVAPVGSFEMIRGRLDFLARRFDFKEGRITMQGNFDPVLSFRAEARSADVLVLVSLSGSASDPDFSLSSSPELPEDEVLARLIFDRGFGDLTTAQTIQLAAAVRELKGGRDSGVFSRIRRASNLDDLDLGTDEEGSLRVRAGKYIDDNIYLDVEARSRGETRATISLDLNTNFTAKATAGTDGETSIGLFYQKDY